MPRRAAVIRDVSVRRRIGRPPSFTGAPRPAGKPRRPAVRTTTRGNGARAPFRPAHYRIGRAKSVVWSVEYEQAFRRSALSRELAGRGRQRVGVSRDGGQRARSAAGEGLRQSGGDGGRPHRVLGGSPEERGGEGAAPEGLLAQPRARGHRAPTWTRPRARHYRREGGRRPARVPEAARDRRHPDAGPRAVAREGVGAARGDAAARPAWKLPRPSRRPASIGRRQRAARRGARRQRWPVLESRPGHGRGRRLDRQPRDPDHRPGGSSGGSLLDGARRMGVGDELARARAARDPDRGERAAGRSRRGGRGAEADLRGQGAQPKGGRHDGPASLVRSNDRDRRARPRGARHRSKRARRIGMGSRGVVVRAVRARRRRADLAVPDPARDSCGGGERPAERAGALGTRHRDHRVHWDAGLAIGRPPGGAGPRRGGADVRDRQADRPCRRRLRSGATVGRFKAVIFDAYGTLLRNDDLMLVPRQMVADHGLSARIDEVWRAWSDLYFEATQLGPFRTLREIEAQILPRVLRRFDVTADAAPYVELFSQVTTTIELYPETLHVLNALGHVRTAILSNADHEHVAAWNVTLPVDFILISEAVRAYKPHRLVFQRALDQLGLEPHEVLHVGDRDVDDVKGAKEAGLSVAWVNRDGRARRSDVPPPDFELRDLRQVPRLLRRE